MKQLGISIYAISALCMAIIPSYGKGDCGMRMDTMYDAYGKPVLRSCY